MHYLCLIYALSMHYLCLSYGVSMTKICGKNGKKGRKRKKWFNWALFGKIGKMREFRKRRKQGEKLMINASSRRRGIPAGREGDGRPCDTSASLTLIINHYLCVIF